MASQETSEGLHVMGDLALAGEITSARTAWRSARANAAHTCCLGLASLALLLATGCSSLDESQESYATYYNLPDEGGDAPLPENWACLESNQPPMVPADPNRVLTFTGFVFDYRSVMPLPTATLKTCIVTDVACVDGITKGIVMPPQREGLPPSMTAPLPYGFEGFFRLEAEGYIPYDYFLGGPMVADVLATQPFNMISQSSLQEFSVGLGADPAVIASAGVLGLQVFDCNNDPAADVTLRLTDLDSRPSLLAAQAWAAVDRIPVLNRPTDNDGIGGFIMLPIENVVIEAEVLGRLFGRRGIVIRPGRLTAATIRPDYTIGR
jgi:hypothetical protein